MRSITVNAGDVHRSACDGLDGDRCASRAMREWSVANGVGHCSEFEVLDEGGHVIRVTFVVQNRRNGTSVVEWVNGVPRPAYVTAIVHVHTPMPPILLGYGHLT